MASNLTDAQLGAAVSVTLFIGGAVGFLVKRWLTQSSTHERTALLSSLADLRAKMRTEGVSLDQIIELENMVRGKVNVSKETAEAVTGQSEVDDDANLPPGYWTTAAMRGRAHARFAVVDAQLDEAFTELATLVSHEETEPLSKSHTAWQTYRDQQIDYAYARYPGGTSGPLYGTLHGIEVTERRLAELQQEIEARRAELRST
jgi:uncharacterized protein YecT (DUF1311 family)